MKALLPELNKHINDLIGLYFYRKVDGIIQKMADASYSVYLKEIIDANNITNLKFTNGMDNAGKSDFTVTIPNNAVSTKETETIWQVEYSTPNDVVVIKFFFPELKRVIDTNSNSENQGIREVRNSQNELEKLIIETPDNGVSIQFLSLVKKILTQILTSWKTFTVDSSERTDDENRVVYEFSSLESVNLPGNTFFEALLNSPVGTTTIEISTTLTINLKESTVTYRLEDIPYTIKKIQ